MFETKKLNMIEKILHKKKLLAILVRKNYRKKKGINFFTPNHLNLQCGFMKHKKKSYNKTSLTFKKIKQNFLYIRNYCSS